MNVDKKFPPTEITVCQWQTKNRKLKTSKVSGLKKLHYQTYIKHNYTANYQWHAHSALWNNLDESSVITVEDYQMNIEIEFGENPTLSACSTNKLL